jgi:putative thioredoxin
MTVPVVVDLWAEWCGPCKRSVRSSRRSIDETGGAVELAKVDVDTNPQIAQAFNVQSIPAVFAIHEGKIVDSFVGAFPESTVREFVEKLAPGRPRSTNSWTPVTKRRFARRWNSTRRTSTPRSRSAISCVATIDSTRPTRSSSRSRTSWPPRRPRARPTAAQWRLPRRRPRPDARALARAVLKRAECQGLLLEILDALGPEDPRYVSYRRKLASRLY